MTKIEIRKKVKVLEINDVSLVLNERVFSDYGIDIKNDHSNIGEFYSFWSFRFINAIMLYLV